MPAKENYTGLKHDQSESSDRELNSKSPFQNGGWRMRGRLAAGALFALLSMGAAHASIVDVSINQNLPLNTFQTIYGITLYNYFQPAAIDPLHTTLYATGLRIGSAPDGGLARIGGAVVPANASVGPSTTFLPVKNFFGQPYMQDIAYHNPTQVGPLLSVFWDEYVLPSGSQLLLPALFSLGDGTQLPAQIPYYYGVLRMTIEDGGQGVPFSARVGGISYENSGGIYAPVPETHTYAMLLLGLGCIAIATRRKRKLLGLRLETANRRSSTTQCMPVLEPGA